MRAWLATTTLAVIALLASAGRAQRRGPEPIPSTRRSLVRVRCPAWIGRERIGFAFGDRRTVVTPSAALDCRVPPEVVLEDGEVVPIRHVRASERSALALLELTRALPARVEPIRDRPAGVPREGEPLFSFELPPPERRHGGFVPWSACVERVEPLRLSARLPRSGAPVVDARGRLVGVTRAGIRARREDEPELVARGELLELARDPPAPRSPGRDLSAGGGFGPAVLFEPAVPGAPDIVGVGFELGFELAWRDEWALESSVALVGLDPDGDQFSGLRLQVELRGAYRVRLASWAVVELGLGAALGYERRPEWTVGADGERGWVRPTARVSLRLALADLTYAVYLDPEVPGASTHYWMIGFAIEP